MNKTLIRVWWRNITRQQKQNSSRLFLKCISKIWISVFLSFSFCSIRIMLSLLGGTIFLSANIAWSSNNISVMAKNSFLHIHLLSIDTHSLLYSFEIQLIGHTCILVVYVYYYHTQKKTIANFGSVSDLQVFCRSD